MSGSRLWLGMGAVLALAGAAPVLSAQTLAEQVSDVDGRVRFSYPAAEGVCGTGEGILILEADGSTHLISSRRSTREWRAWRPGQPPCIRGDVYVEATITEAGWRGVRLGVGEPDYRAPDVRTLGAASGQQAGDVLLAAAAISPVAADDLLLAATLAADAVIWPGLLELARDRSQDSQVRRSALFQLGRRAAREAVEALGGIVRDATEADEVRQAAVFALSRLPEDQGVPMLIDLVRTTDDARVVRHALFWLADLEDPRALALFEEILLGSGG